MTVIGPLGDSLHPEKSTNSNLTEEQIQHLSAIHLASCCLYNLHEYEDCLTLLESLLHLEGGNIGTKAASHCLKLLSIHSSEIHIMSGNY